MASQYAQYELLAIIKEEVICEFCEVMRCLCDSNEVIIVTKGDHIYLSGTDVEGWQHPIIKLKAPMFSKYHASYEIIYKLLSPGIKPIFKSFTKVSRLMLYVEQNSDRIVFEIGDQTADVMKFSRNYTNLANFDLVISTTNPKDCKNKWTIAPLIMREWLNELGRTVDEITFHHIKNEGIHIRAVDKMEEDEDRVGQSVLSNFFVNKDTFEEFEIDKAWSLTLFIPHLRKICNLAYSINSFLKVYFSTEEDETLKKSNLFRMHILFNSEEEFIKLEAMMFGSLAGSTNPNNVRIPQATMDVLERNEHPEDTLHIAEGGMISIEEHRMLLQ